MADDVNANIRIDLDTSDAVASLRTLQAQISAFNQSVIKSNATAVAAQKGMLSTLTAQIGATQQFTTSMVNVESSVSRLGRSIDKNKLSLGEYFRYGVASSKNFGRVFGREHTAIMDLAADRVKRLQTQYIALGEAQNGMTRAMAIRPMNLFNADAAMAIQRQQIFNKLLHDGSTSLINFGKNTQWAGRQLMVGFTVPLTIFGGVAGKIFMDLERQIVKFRRVYGDATTPLEETNGMIDQVKELAKEFTKYGIAVSDTIGLAGDAAAAGAQGADLLAATAQSTRLSTLGMIDQQQALTATIALQSAFRMNTEELANSVNFLNAVENQTVVSLADITEAIPKVAPVIQGLGGDVQDLAVFMAAMREGGVSAAEGANALKSGLASLINPTKNAREQLAKVGIDIDAILSKNKGDIRATVTEFGAALGTLDKFSRQQTLAKVFGKYQFARLGALFENISRQGSQAQRVIDLTTMSVEDLGALAEKELGAIEQSVGVKFTAAVEKFRLAIAPIGEVFLRVATPIIDFATKLLDKFNELSPGVKNFIAILVGGLGVVVPTVIMLIGLFANFAGNAVKGLSLINNLFNRIRGGAGTFEYLSSEQLDAAAAAASLEGQTNSLTGALNIQRTAVGQLARAYGTYTAAAQASAANLPQGFRRAPRKMATGGLVGGTGNKDSEPTLLTPGEFVMNKGATEQFGPILDAMNRGTISQLADGSRLTQRTHLTGAVSVTATEAMLERVTNSTRQMLSVIQKVEQVLGRSISNISKVSNLIVEMPSEFNQAMKSGIGQGQFATQFGATGVEKFKTTAAIAKQDFETLRPHLEILDREIINASKDFAVVGDMNIDEITKKAFSRLPEESRKMLSEIEALSTQYNNLRVSVQDLNRITNEERQRLEAAGISFRTGADPNRQYITAPGMGTASTRTRQETRSAGPTYRRSPLFLSPEIVQESRKLAIVASKAAGDAMIKEMTQASRKAGQVIAPNLMLGANAASPPPWSIQLGGWIGQGIEQGMTGSLADINAKLRAKMMTPQGGFLLPPGPTSSLPQGGIEDVANQANQTAGAMSKVKGAASKFGSTLMRGSMKMQGALFAIDGLVFAASMMGGSMGQFAQKILPFVFGFQGLTAILPTLKALLIGMISPLGLAVTAFAGLAAVVIIGRNKIEDTLNEAVNKGKEAANSLSDIAKIGEAFGKSFRTINVQKLGLQTQQKTKAQQYFETEQGTAEIQRLAEQRGNLGREAFSQTLAQDIATAAITQGLSGKQIDAYISTVAEKLNDKILYSKVRGELVELLDPENKQNILEKGLLIKVNAKAATDFLREGMKIPQASLDQMRVDIGTVFARATPKGIQQAAVSEADRIATQIEKLKDEQIALANSIAEGVPGAQEKYNDLELQINSLTTQLNFASREINYNNVELEDIALSFEMASKYGAIFGEKLTLTNQFIAYQRQLLDSGEISQKKYNKRIAEANKVLSYNSTAMKQAAKGLQGLEDGGQALSQFMKQIGDQLFVGLDEEFRTKIDQALSGIKDVSASIDLQIAYAQGSISAQDIVDLAAAVDSFPPFARTDLIIAYGQGSLTSAELAYLKENADALVGLDGSQIDFIISVSGLDNMIQAIDIIKQINALGPITDANFMQYSALQNKLSGLAKDIKQTEKTPTEKETPPGEPPPTDTGEKTKSWLEQLMKDTESSLAIFPGMLNKIKQKYPNIPMQILEAIGVGEEGQKRAQEILNASPKKFREFLQKYQQKMIRESSNALSIKVQQRQQQTAARGQLQARTVDGRKIEKDVIEEILQDEGAIAAILAGNVKKINEYVRGYRQLQKEQNPVEQAIEKIKKETADTVKGIDKQITAQEKVVRGIQDQIDVLEEKNAVDQWAIRNKEREKELIDRQIEALERANEMDERRVETLQRQDELRNREADALSRELDELSKVEEQIRKSYQDRIDALDKVAQINSFILNQQKQQLGLAQALSEGDIYAATAAAQEMRASQADFAQQQIRAGLEQGMEGAVAGLRTAGGLTRQQAEERINQIKEQSYQTSLQIRDIEDQIYARTQQMIPLKDQQYAIDLQIREIADRIFDRETEINKIRTDQLTPAQTIVDKLNEQKASVQNMSDEQITQLETMVDAADGYDMLTNKAGDLADNWALVGQNIAAANKAAKEGLAALGKAPTPKKGESDRQFAARVAAYEQKRADIEARRVGTINAELAKGMAAIPKAVNAYAGGRIMKYGMGKKVMGYAAGNVVGTGSRDSVPAMLTPGEFVVRKAMVDKYGSPMLQAINQGAFGMPRFNTQQSIGGNISVKTQNTSSIMAPMYNNYSVNVSVSNTNASADEIANRTLMKIKQMQDVQIRSNRGY